MEIYLLVATNLREDCFSKYFSLHTLSHKKKLFFVFSKIIENNVNLYQQNLGV